jgi:hypothetical protein
MKTMAKAVAVNMPLWKFVTWVHVPLLSSLLPVSMVRFTHVKDVNLKTINVFVSFPLSSQRNLNALAFKILPTKANT